MAVNRLRLGLATAAGLAVAIWCCGLRAADKPGAGQADADAASDSDAGAKQEKAKETDRYAVPDGDAKTLLTFFREIRDFKPTTTEELRKHRLKALAAMKAAAEQIKETATEDDKLLDGYHDAMDLLLYIRVATMRDPSPEDVQKALEEVKAALQEPRKPTPYLIAAASNIAQTFEYSEHPERAVDIYRELGGVLAKSQYPDIAKQGAQMEGAARRLSLVGNPLEISGTLMDGSPFDWKSYRGKVVLVDFWATWCGPCRAELPNVKENYQRYHDKGFEVVAISLDGDRAALEEFLAKEQNPWVTLHDGDWSDNAVATYYGVMGIPTVILVGKDGNVVSTSARGPELGKLLAQLLGPADEDAKEAGGEEKAN